MGKHVRKPKNSNKKLQKKRLHKASVSSINKQQKRQQLSKQLAKNTKKMKELEEAVKTHHKQAALAAIGGRLSELYVDEIVSENETIRQEWETRTVSRLEVNGLESLHGLNCFQQQFDTAKGTGNKLSMFFDVKKLSRTLKGNCKTMVQAVITEVFKTAMKEAGEKIREVKVGKKKANSRFQKEMSRLLEVVEKDLAQRLEPSPILGKVKIN